MARRSSADISSGTEKPVSLLAHALPITQPMM